MEERDATEDHVADTAASGDQRASDIAEASSIDKNLQLDMLPPDLAGKVKAYKATNSCRLKPGSSSMNSSNV